MVRRWSTLTITLEMTVQGDSTLIRDAMHDAKGLVEMITRLTLCLALLPAILYGGWLSLGRPFEGPQHDQAREREV
jgi:hypothetical protein